MLSGSNVDVAARAAANATITSASVVDVTPAASGTSVSSALRARSAQELMLNLTRQIVADDRAKGAAGSSDMVKAMDIITRTDACAAGGTVTRALDDRDRSGAARPARAMS